MRQNSSNTDNGQELDLHLLLLPKLLATISKNCMPNAFVVFSEKFEWEIDGISKGTVDQIASTQTLKNLQEKLNAGANVSSIYIFC